MSLKLAISVLTVALFLFLIVQLFRHHPAEHSGGQATAGIIGIEEIRRRLQRVKAEYKGDPKDFDQTVETALASLQARYGDRIPAVEVVKLLSHSQLSEGQTPSLPHKPESEPDRAATDAQQPPEGIEVEQSPGGFSLYASCRSLVGAAVWVVFGAVLVILPFRLWGDLIRGFWTDDGLSFWLTGVFLAVWAGAVLYVSANAAFNVWGHIEITQAGDSGAVFAGIGKLGWTHHLHWSEFQKVSDEEAASGYSSARFSRATHYIVLRGSSARYKFGSDLSPAQRAFVVTFLGRHAVRSR